MAATTIGSMAVMLSANTAAFMRGFDQASEQLKSFRREAKRTADTSKGLGESIAGKGSEEMTALGKIEMVLGKGSPLAKFGQALKGGGALTAISLITTGLQRMVDNWQKALDLSREMPDTMGFGDMAEAAIKSVPVYGQVWSLGRKIHDAAQDTVAWVSRTVFGVSDWSRGLESVETQYKRIKADAKIVDEITEDARKHVRAAEIAGFGGPAQQVVRAQADYLDELTRIKELRGKAEAIQGPAERRQAMFGLEQLERAATAQRDAAFAAVGSAKEIARILKDVDTGPLVRSAREAVSGPTRGDDPIVRNTDETAENTKAMVREMQETNQYLRAQRVVGI